MQFITKDIFLNTIFCTTLGWRLRNQKIQTDSSPGQLFRMEQGKEIGRLARTLYPEGIFVNEFEPHTAAIYTNDILKNSTHRVLFEATFLADNYITKADILIRDEDRWELIEVKSTVADKKEFIDDMAYTTMIAQAAGLSPSVVSLMLIDRNYRFGMPTEQLFVKLDMTEKVLDRVEEFKTVFDSVDAITGTPNESKPKLTFNCKNCIQFNECHGEDTGAHIFEIPRIRQNKIEDLIASGITSIHEIPDNFPLSDNQRQVVKCVQCGEMEVDSDLQNKLSEIQWPAYYLDFETMMAALPLWPDIAPYEQIPVQYSLHVCDDPGTIICHAEYLADPQRDCRRDLAKRLIEDCKGKGSIISYSSFEKTTITKLIKTFPDLSEELQSLIDRIVDLEKCIKCINHPEFCGRTSIKIVLPVLVPALSYNGLEIADGDTALVTFAKMAQGKMDTEDMEKNRADLLEYCKMDTLAMVRLHEVLDGFSTRNCETIHELSDI